MIRDRRAGIVLLLLSGVVGILLILAMALLLMTRSWARGADARREAAQARLASAGGMEYAASRLSRERTYPRFSATPIDRGDDWIERQGAENPSYSHGEPWTEGGTPDGLYTPVDARGPDLDGDGRFSAWSGRLRGAGLRFSLRIEAVGGKVPVNAGGAATTYYAKGLAHLLNNLGAILFPDDGSRAWRKDAASGVPLGAGEPILCSRLGTDLFAARPSKGYASLDKIDAALKALGYSAPDRERILPYLDVGPYESKPDGGRPTYPYVPIEMATAPPEVLQAAWMYLQGRIRYCPGEPQTFDNFYRRSGPTNLKFSMTAPAGPVSSMTAMVFPDEAAALAAETVDLRREGLYSWIALRDRFLQKAQTIFAKDVDDLDEAFVNPATPAAQHGWAHGKADIAYYAVAQLPPPYPPTPQVVNTLPAPSEARPIALLDPTGFSVFGHVRYPDFATGYGANGNVPFYNLENLDPEGLTLAPPGVFRVASLGGAQGRASAAVSSVLRAFERLDISSQEDYENRSGGALLEAARGLRVEDPLPAQKRPALADPESGRTYPQVASIPLRGGADRYAGGLVLAGRECGVLGSQQYWPFSETSSGGTDGWSVTSGISYQVRAGGIPHAPTGGGNGFPFQCPGMDGPTFFLGSPVVDLFSMEAWRMPGLPGGSLKITSTNNAVINWSFHAGREIQGGRPGYRLSFQPGAYLIPNTGTSAPSEIFVPDYDASGNASAGFFHYVMTVRRYLATPPNRYRTRLHCYLNGEELVPGGQDIPLPPDYARMIWKTGAEYFLSFLSDEIRLYATELPSGDAKSHYDMGRFVPPWTGPSADPRLAPANPAYRSPRYVLDGGKVRWASWTSWSSAALKDKVRLRVLLYGLDASGDEIWKEELPAAGPWGTLPALPTAHSFQYVVEFYSPTGSPEPPLLDTPVFGPISFCVQRRGGLPAWTAWEYALR